MGDNVLRMFTIVRDPADLPGVAFSVREWLIAPGRGEPVSGEILGTADTLPQARSLVPESAGACLGRQADDDPNIVETWV